MQGAGLDDGDLLVIDRSKEPEDNAIAVCFIDGEFTVKRLKVEAECVYLMPENPNYSPIKVTEDNQLIIWGVVTYVVKKFNLLYRKTQHPLSRFIFGLSALHLWAQLFKYSLLASGTKTLIIPALALWVFQRFRLNKQLGWALFFSWLGDLLLIPDGTPYFIAGILAFWAAQLLYCRMMMGHFEGSFSSNSARRKLYFPCCC